jgi:hypothetical protein
MCSIKYGLFVSICLIGIIALPACYSWPYNTRPHTYAAALGDLDGDGDLDAYLANGKNEGVVEDTVWLNDGEGGFYDPIGQGYEAETHFVSLGDMDGDGDLDAVTSLGIAYNDGSGGFAYPRAHFYVIESGAYTYSPALGDLDGDGDLDLVLGGCCGARAASDPPEFVYYAFNMVWFNDGRGGLQDSGQRLGVSGTGSLALGDLDGDGDLDVFEPNSGSMVGEKGEHEGNQPNLVRLNDGSGKFIESDQRLGSEESYAAALGDLDGDGDLDALVGNRGPDHIWLNDGTGRFSMSNQELGRGDTRWVSLEDLDGDGDLDAFLGGRGFIEIWLNRGGAQSGSAGLFRHSQRFTHSIWYASTLGDVDGDGDLDIFAGLLDRETIVWRNDGSGRFK